MSRKIGLFVGINEYVNDKTATLRYAVKDASSMADVFKKSGYETYLLSDRQATAHNLQHALSQITTSLSPGDMFLFYFSGHGAEFERKHLLICSNFDPNMYAAGTLTLNKVNQLTRKEGIERLFIIDSCRVKWDNDNEKSFTINGKKKEFYQYISDVYTKETQEAGVIYNSVAEPIILTSCSSGETSVELTVGGHGFFTRHLLNILLSNTTYLTYRGLVLGLANSIGNTGQHPFETKPLNANPLIFGDKYSSGEDYCNKPGCLLGGLGFLSNVAASDLKKTSACDDPILIRKLKQGEKCNADEKKRIYNVKDSDGVFITSHIAECDVNSRKYNKLDGSNFYVSAMSFPIEINANLQHKDCPGGIQVRTSLLVKLHPGFSSFGEWVTRTVSDKITLSELTRLLQDKAYGLNLYLQKIIDGVNSFGLVSRYGREAVAWTGQDEALPEWLEIKNVQYLDAKALPTIVEQQRDAFNEKQQSLQQDIAERQQSLDYYIKVTEIDQAREEIAARNKILKEERERNITVAQQETQIEVMKNNLKLQKLKAESRFLDAKLARDIKMCELDIVEKEEKLQSIRVAREENAANIRKIDAEIIRMGPKATTIKTLIITGIVSIAVIGVILITTYNLYYTFCAWDSGFDHQYTTLSQKYESFRKYGYNNYAEKAFSDFDYYLKQIQDLKRKTLRTRNEVKELLQNAELSCKKLEKIATYDKIGKLTYPATREDKKRLEEEFNKLSRDFEKMDIYPETASQHWLCCKTELNKCSESLEMNLPEAGKELQNAKKYFEDLRRIRNGWLDSLQSSYEKNILMFQNIKIQDLQDILKEEEQTINNDMEKLKKLSSGDQTYWMQLKKLEKKLQIFTIRIKKICEIQELKRQEEKQRNELFALWEPTTESQKKKLSSNKTHCDECLKKSIALLKHNNIDERILKELELIKEQWETCITELSSRMTDEKSFIEQQMTNVMSYYDNGKWDEAINASQKIISRCKSQKIVSQANKIKGEAHKGKQQENFLRSLKKYHNILTSDSAIKKSADFLALDLSAEQHLKELKIQFSHTISLPTVNDIEYFIRNSKDNLATCNEQDLHKKVSNIIKNDLQANPIAFFGELLYLFAIYYETIAHSDKQESSHFSSKAYEMYRKSANYGNQLAQRRMGYIFCLGLLGQKKNEIQALKWLQKQNSRCKIFKQIRGF